MYRAYYGPAGCGAVSPLEKDRSPFKGFANLDEALAWTRAVARKGTAVTAIEGDDGTRIGRGELASYIRQTGLAGA